jgi:5-formyltetrahydrofolate cyclo-ligase
LNKPTIRNDLILKRASLQSERRKRAEELLFLELSHLALSHDLILSFASFGTEIDLSSLNHFLATNNQLLLPRVEGDGLSVYRVKRPEKELMAHPFGFLEPNPLFCERIPHDKISLILVPGLGFDPSYQRIGYGKGFYDRLLKMHPHIPTIGVGFREQMIASFPHDLHDIPLKSLRLF